MNKENGVEANWMDRGRCQCSALLGRRDRLQCGMVPVCYHLMVRLFTDRDL